MAVQRINTTSATTEAMPTYRGLRNIFRGMLPITRSRIAPPPVAVAMARTMTPNRSIFLPTPTSAPEMAKATVPRKSKKRTRAAVMGKPP